MDAIASTIFLSRQADDKVLAVSIDSPRFCVSAASESDALAKAQRAIAYYNANKHKLNAIKLRDS